jgi:hypothetical protein
MLTLTAPYKVSQLGAHRLTERFYRFILQSDKSAIFFCCAEKFKETDSYHIHGVINTVLKPDELKGLYRRAVGKCNIQPRIDIVVYDPKMHGVFYITKSMNKFSEHNFYTPTYLQ